MKNIGFLVLTSALFVSAACFAEETSFSYRFADAAEGAELRLSHTEYFDNMGRYDLEYRLQKKDATLEELKTFAAGQMLDFTEEEKSILADGMDDIAGICDERGYVLPDEGDIVFVKSTMKDEQNAAAYTHGNEIYVGESLLSDGLSDDPEVQAEFKEVLAHELFHCLTRNNPDFRRDIYGILGFTVEDEDYEFPQQIKDIIINNPDVEHHDSHAVFSIDGEEKDCVVIFTTTKPFEKEGDSFFHYAMTGLVPVDGLDTVYSSDDADNFWDVFGKNTDYVIDPEETMADNFSYTIMYGPDGKEYETPGIIEQLDSYLKKGVTAKELVTEQLQKGNES